MKAIICALAILPLLDVTVSAEPMRLTEMQMDRVTAGESLTTFQISPLVVPGGGLIAKNQADALLASIVNQYLTLVLPRIGPNGQR